MSGLNNAVRRVGSVIRRSAGIFTGAAPTRRQQEHLRRIFDPTFYLDSNPDVRAAGVDPWSHFVAHGFREGRAPRASASERVPLSTVPRRVPEPSGPRVTVYTSINLAYLDRALVLAESLARHHPEWHRVVVLVEPNRPTGQLLTALEAFDEVIVARDLFDETFDSWVFGLTVVEACTAVKGAALSALLARDDCDVVLYMDPDTWLLRPMESVLDALSRSSAVLTPHVLEPANTDPAIWDGEVGSLKHGIYNLGFLGIRDCPEGRALAGWWAERLRMACWDDPSRGLFTDQKWMNLAPVFFPGVEVLRDPGLNVASWNLNTRRVRRVSDGYTANDEPLTFFHFTKAETVGPQMTSLHAPDSSGVADLWTAYLRDLRGVRSTLPPIPEWGYARYYDGTPVSIEDRVLSREGRSPAQENPFAARHRGRNRVVGRIRRRWRR